MNKMILRPLERVQCSHHKKQEDKGYCLLDGVPQNPI